MVTDGWIGGEVRPAPASVEKREQTMKQDRIFGIAAVLLGFIGVLAVAALAGIVIIAFCDYIKAVAGTGAALVALLGIAALALGLCIGFFGRREER